MYDKLIKLNYDKNVRATLKLLANRNHLLASLHLNLRCARLLHLLQNRRILRWTATNRLPIDSQYLVSSLKP